MNISFDGKQFERAIMDEAKKAARQKMNQINREICSITCPEHGGHPTVAPDAHTPDQFNFSTCCDKLKSLVEAKIAQYR